MDTKSIIKVRWNKNYFSVDKTPLKSILDLKNEIQKHSQVQSDEQLMILKGKVLQDVDNISIIPSNS